MFRKMIVRLDNQYRIQAEKCTYDIAVGVFCDDVLVGNARLTTDNIDVSCITELAMEEKHVDHLLLNQRTVGDAFVKFLLKFPSIVRKPEFRFILETPECLKPIVAAHHFDRGDHTSIEKEILIRQIKISPPDADLPDNIHINYCIQENKLDKLLIFLQKNAYWQKNLTMDRLKILLSNSLCLFAMSDEDEIVGFSRVLTNYKSFASLWDVVVAEEYRGKNIGTVMMHQIFSHKQLCNISNWILFTESAKKLYEKFGFVSAAHIPDRKLIHKLRLQDSQPAYMQELMQATLSGLIVDLNPAQAYLFLYDATGKRNQLSYFWRESSKIKTVSETTSGLSPGAPVLGVRLP